MALVMISRVGYFSKLIKSNKPCTNSYTNVYTHGSGYPGFEDKRSKSITAVPMAFSSYELCPSKVCSDKLCDCPILIMHELFSSKDHWSTWSKSLYKATHRKVIAFDARNHGDSVHALDMTLHHLAEDIRASMLQMDIAQATLIGHRMGARAMMLMAFKYPKLVKDMIIVDMSPGSPESHVIDIPRYLEAMHTVRIHSNMTYEVARRSINGQLAKAIPSPVVRELVLSNVLQVRNCEYKWRLNLIGIAMNVPAIENPVIIKSRHYFEKPTLFIDGHKSPTITKDQRGSLRRTFKRAEFQTIADAGNQAQLKISTEFFKCVIGFLAKNSKYEAKHSITTKK